MNVLLSFATGFLGHWFLYDACGRLPHSDLARRAAGVIIARPVMKIVQRTWGEEAAYWTTFTWIGIGVAIARLIRKKKREG